VLERDGVEPMRLLEELWRSLEFGRQFAPFAGITPQVLRVSAGGTCFPDAISAGLPASTPGIRIYYRNAIACSCWPISNAQT